MAMLPLNLDDAALICGALDAAADKVSSLAINGEPARAAERLQLHQRMRELRDRVHATVLVQSTPGVPNHYADRTPEQRALTDRVGPVDTFPLDHPSRVAA